MPTDSIPMTREGHARLMSELEELKKVQRPAVITAIQEARAQGDLSENAEYDAAKEKQGKIEDRISELEDKIARAAIIETDVARSDKVIFGAAVTVRDETAGREVEYTLVGPEDVDLLRNRISIQSPIGKALVGTRPGEVVQVQTPRGPKPFRVLSFR